MLMLVALILFTVFGEESHILQRPQLLLFFGIGMWVRLAAYDEKTINRAAGFLTIGSLS